MDKIIYNKSIKVSLLTISSNYEYPITRKGYDRRKAEER